MALQATTALPNREHFSDRYQLLRARPYLKVGTAVRVAPAVPAAGVTSFLGC
jgi:predicted glycoside hydrolase/deacetylase ChbG (UPF0249 family)